MKSNSPDNKQGALKGQKGIHRQDLDTIQQKNGFELRKQARYQAKKFEKYEQLQTAPICLGVHLLEMQSTLIQHL